MRLYGDAARLARYIYSDDFKHWLAKKLRVKVDAIMEIRIFLMDCEDWWVSFLTYAYRGRKLRDFRFSV